MEKSLIALIAVSVITTSALIGTFIKMKNGFGPFNLKIYGLTLVIGVSAILALAGIEANVLTAVFSILGAIAGYLFGLKKE